MIVLRTSSDLVAGSTGCNILVKAELASVTVNNYLQGVQSNLLSRKLYVQKFVGLKMFLIFRLLGEIAYPI